MDKEKFDSLKEWKQKDLKKKVNLFWEMFIFFNKLNEIVLEYFNFYF